MLALRDWRPRSLSALALGLAVVWNLSPLTSSFAQSRSDPAANASYWTPAIRYLRSHLTPDYRVEAVDTVGHWDAVYLPRAGIPLARGWFRQDDFPQNAVLYGRLGASAYLAWLHRLGIGYVVLTKAPPDYSAQAEARLVASGLAGLHLVFVRPQLTIYAVESPSPLVTGPGRARVLAFDQSRIAITVNRPGVYRVAVHASPYWHVTPGCLSRGADGMIRLHIPRSGQARLTFDFSLQSAIQALTGAPHHPCQ